jgi:TPR repeat protein
MSEYKAQADALFEEGKFSEAAELYRKAAESGDADAQYKLGRICYKARDYAGAVKYYTSAAENGHDGAMKCLAAAYQLGDGVDESAQNAVYWYTRAAESGNVKAMLYVGYYNETGYGMEASIHKAMEWWKRALDASGGKCCEAAYKLGHYYYAGVDGKRDLMQARFYFILADKTGYECSGILERVEKELNADSRRY